MYVYCMIGGLAPVAGAPLPPGLTCPPNALGSLICGVQGVSDVSAGGQCLFKVANLNTVSLISRTLRLSPQFQRRAPAMTSLVNFVLITSLASPEQELLDFNINY
jgi:hypothetical protein